MNSPRPLREWIFSLLKGPPTMWDRMMKSTWLSTDCRISRSARDWWSVLFCITMSSGSSPNESLYEPDPKRVSLLPMTLVSPDENLLPIRFSPCPIYYLTVICVPPSLPRWRLEGFPLPRNSLGKRFREFSAGGSATSLSQDCPSRRPTAIWDRDDCLN